MKNAGKPLKISEKSGFFKLPVVRTDGYNKYACHTRFIIY